MSTRGPRAYDMAMREDGFVTAAEVARILGWSLPTIHTAIRKGRVPGKATPSIGGATLRWYVDLRKFVAAYPKNGASAPLADLKALLKELPR